MGIVNRRVLAILVVSFWGVTTVNGGERTWKAEDAAKYMDGRAAWWMEWPNAARGEGTSCVSCHTTLGYALARPALGQVLGEKQPRIVEKQLFDNVKKRVAGWDKVVGDGPFRPFYGGERKPSALGTEAVLNALVLVNYDARRGKDVLSADAKQALAHLWTTQQKDGTWQWLEFGLRPWETDAKYFGASLAGLAVGMAGKNYYEQADVQPKVALLKKYLTNGAATQRLHDRMILLWAAAKLPGALRDDDKNAIVKAILDSQEADGGWTSARLGHANQKKTAWTSHGLTRTGTISDGYATGLAVLALKGSGLAGDNANLKKAIAWLSANQKDGVWPGTYLNKNRDPESDVGQFMRDASTAFAVLALAP